MASLLKKIQRSRQKDYHIIHLVDHRVVLPGWQQVSQNHIICDIDKTYLETEFETVAKMARIAFEKAEDKTTVSGAAEVLHAARWSYAERKFRESAETKIQPPHASLHFVSSSPPQLRQVLEEKFRADLIDWDSDTFKNQAYNLRKARMDMLKHHVAYKSLAILSVLSPMKEGQRVYLIGDNAESDPLIYSGIKMLCNKLISIKDYREILEKNGVDKEIAGEIEALIEEPPAVKVGGIFIRKIPGKIPMEDDFTSSHCSFFRNYFELALYLFVAGMISEDACERLTQMFVNRYGLTFIAASDSLAQLLEHPKLNHTQRQFFERLTQFCNAETRRPLEGHHLQVGMNYLFA